MTNRITIFLLFVSVCASLCSFMVVAAESNSIEIDKNTMEVLQKARTQFKTDPGAAERVLQNYLKSNRHVVVLYELGLYKARRGDNQGAAVLYQEVIERNPKFPGARKNIGLLYYQMGQSEKAVDSLRKGIADEGPDADSCTVLSAAYLAAEKPFAAETAVRWALVQKPDDPSLLLTLSHALYGQRRFGASEKAALRIIRNKPDSAEAWVVAANACIADSRPGNAIDHLEAMIRLSDKPPVKVFWTLGDLYVQEGLPLPAADHYGKALEVGGKEPKTLVRLQALMHTFYEDGNTDAAQKFSNEILKLKPNDSSALITAAHIQRENGQGAKALEIYKKAAKADPLSGEALLHAGMLTWELKKDFAAAVSLYRSARSISRYEEAALRAETNLCLGAKRYAQALELLELLKEKYPSAAWSELIQEIRAYIQNQPEE